MDEAAFRERLGDALNAFRHDDVNDIPLAESYESIMDDLAVRCDDEQWQCVVDMLDAERKRLQQVAGTAARRLDRADEIRLDKERPVAGIVWSSSRVQFDSVELMGVFATRARAIQAAEADALEAARDARPNAKSAGWRESWTRAQSACPCPIVSCGHQRWVRQVRSGYEYVIQSWSVTDDTRRTDDPV
jgi:hypothetical protein